MRLLARRRSVVAMFNSRAFAANLAALDTEAAAAEIVGVSATGN
jgi:hypothetical protein